MAAHLLLHDSRLSIELQVGLLLLPELAFIFDADVVELMITVFLYLLLYFLKLSQMLLRLVLTLTTSRSKQAHKSQAS